MKVGEIRVSLLQLDADGKHTKHVALTITNPTLCAAIQALIAPALDLEKAEDASSHEIKPGDKTSEPEPTKAA